MLSGPEVAKILLQFESQHYQFDNDPDLDNPLPNHETGRSAQKNYQKQVNDDSIKNIIIQWFGLVYDFGFRKHFYDTATDFFC